MSAMSDYLEAAQLNAILRGGTYTGGAVYFALFTTNPTDAGTGQEVSDASYQRQRAHASAVSDGFTVPNASGQSSNTRTLTFPAITGSEVVVTHIGIYDALTGGNLLFHAPLQVPKTLGSSDVFSLPAGSVIVTLQ